jgi:hypothetical protein
MNKKLAVLLSVFLVAGTSSIFAFGIGLQANSNAEDVYAPGLALTFKLDTIPLVFAANWNIGDTVQTYGLTGDYWAINKPITDIGNSSLNWFLGLGFFLNMTFIEDEDMQSAIGLRLPLGLNMFVIDGLLEPYIMIAPSFGVRFVPSLGAENLFWPMSAGFRIWFK